jgi:hypothetical protein
VPRSHDDSAKRVPGCGGRRSDVPRSDRVRDEIGGEWQRGHCSAAPAVRDRAVHPRGQQRQLLVRELEGGRLPLRWQEPHLLHDRRRTERQPDPIHPRGWERRSLVRGRLRAQQLRRREDHRSRQQEPRRQERLATRRQRPVVQGGRGHRGDRAGRAARCVSVRRQDLPLPGVPAHPGWRHAHVLCDHVHCEGKERESVVRDGHGGVRVRRQVLHDPR